MNNGIGIYLRMFLLQGFWNFARLQNIGMLYIMDPALKRIYEGRMPVYLRAKSRNLETFNSHPAMSGYSIGAMIKQEEKLAEKEGEELLEEEREWRIIRASTANTAASIGDRLFWATLKPLSLVFSFVILFVGQVDILQEEVSTSQSIIAALLALAGSLLIYNIPALIIKFKGLMDSYEGSEDNFYGLINLNWNRMIGFLKVLGQILVLFVIFYAIYIRFRKSSVDPESIARISLLAAFLILSIFMRKLNIPNIFLYLTATIVFSLAAFLA